MGGEKKWRNYVNPSLIPTPSILPKSLLLNIAKSKNNLDEDKTHHARVLYLVDPQACFIDSDGTRGGGVQEFIFITCT